MKKAEILPNMTAIWLRNQTTEFLLGTDRRKFALSVLGGEGFKKFQPETEIFYTLNKEKKIEIPNLYRWICKVGSSRERLFLPSVGRS